MGVHTQPEITSPVSRGQNAAIGVMQNIGTAKGESGGVTGLGGTVNNSIGGTVYNGGGTMSDAPVAPSATVANNNGGSSFAVSTSSVNPLSIQNEVNIAASVDVAVRVTAASNVAQSSTGAETVMPKSQKSAETPAAGGASHINPSATMGGSTTISYDGMQASLVTGSVDDNVINQKMVSTALAEAPAGHNQNGGDFEGPQGLPTSSVQVRDTDDGSQLA